MAKAKTARAKAAPKEKLKPGLNLCRNGKEAAFFAVIAARNATPFFRTSQTYTRINGAKRAVSGAIEYLRTAAFKKVDLNYKDRQKDKNLDVNTVYFLQDKKMRWSVILVGPVGNNYWESCTSYGRLVHAHDGFASFCRFFAEHVDANTIPTNVV